MTREEYGQEYESGRQRTIRFLLSRGVPQDYAADVAQAAWLRGWERISQFRNDSVLGNWINTIALNVYRRASVRERIFEDLTDAAPPATAIDEAAIEVARMLKHCRPEDRTMLEAQMAGVTPQELADQKGSAGLPFVSVFSVPGVPQGRTWSATHPRCPPLSFGDEPPDPRVNPMDAARIA